MPGRQHKIVWAVSLIVLMTGNIAAQYRAPTFCETTPSWDKVKVNNGPIPEGLTKIFVISNRPYTPEGEEGELFPNDISNYRKVSYMIVTCDSAKWQLTFVPDFPAGMKEINDGRDLLLFVEGHGKTLPMALNRAYQVQSRYDVSLVVFDWPSKNRNF